MKNEIIVTPKNGAGLIHNWGSKKRKNDSRTFVGYFFQITFTWNKFKCEKLNSLI
jgi:hypothetical protein